MQSTRVYGIKHSIHPALQHYLLSRPFLSRTELKAASEMVLAPSDTANILTPESCLIKPFHRRYLDDDERLFLPLSPDKLKEEEGEKYEREEPFSLGEQPETEIKKFYPMDDADERAARINSLNV